MRYAPGSEEVGVEDSFEFDVFDESDGEARGLLGGGGGDVGGYYAGVGDLGGGLGEGIYIEKEITERKETKKLTTTSTLPNFSPVPLATSSTSFIFCTSQTFFHTSTPPFFPTVFNSPSKESKSACVLEEITIPDAPALAYERAI